MKKALFFLPFLAGCMASEVNTPASRQQSLVIYDAKTAVSFVQSSEAERVRRLCGKVFTNTLSKWGDGDKLGFFGVMYGAYEGGQCILALDGEGASAEEVAKYVRRNCEASALRITGRIVACVPVLQAVPAKVQRTNSKSLGQPTGQALLRLMKNSGSTFGALALSADGAWSIKKRDTRAKADSDAVKSCADEAGRGYARLGEAALSEMRASCKVVYRFGVDFPRANQVKVVTAPK